MNPVLVAFAAIAFAALLLFVVVRASGARHQQAPTGREEMAISVLPRSSLGKWSVVLAIVFIIAFALLVGLIGALTDPDPFAEGFNPVLEVVFAIILVGTAGASFLTGLVGVIRRKERSLLVFVSMLITFWLGLLGAVGQFFI